MINFISFFTFILVLNISTFYLDDFCLSENKYLRFSQILSPLLFIVLIIFIYYESINTFNVLFIDEAGKKK